MMKRMFAVAVAALLTIPALAEETQKAEKSAEKTETAAKAAPATAPAPIVGTTKTSSGAESPLAAAARRAGRGKSKAPVITDDMVKKTVGGHISTTDSDYLPPSLSKEIAPSAEVIHNEKRAKEKAEAEKKLVEEAAAKEKETKRRARLAAMAEEHEDGIPDDEDPAQVERALRDEAKKQEQPEQEKKP